MSTVEQLCLSHYSKYGATLRGQGCCIHDIITEGGGELEGVLSHRCRRCLYTSMPSWSRKYSGPGEITHFKISIYGECYIFVPAVTTSVMSLPTSTEPRFRVDGEKQWEVCQTILDVHHSWEKKLKSCCQTPNLHQFHPGELQPVQMTESPVMCLYLTARGHRAERPDCCLITTPIYTGMFFFPTK